MEIKDLKVGDEVYVNYWSAYYDYGRRKPLKTLLQRDLSALMEFYLRMMVILEVQDQEFIP